MEVIELAHECAKYKDIPLCRQGVAFGLYHDLVLGMLECSKCCGKCGDSHTAEVRVQKGPDQKPGYCTMCDSICSANGGYKGKDRPASQWEIKKAATQAAYQAAAAQAAATKAAAAKAAAVAVAPDAVPAGKEVAAGKTEQELKQMKLRALQSHATEVGVDDGEL